MNRTIYLSRSTCNVVKIIAALLVMTSHIASFAITKYEATNPIFYATATQNGYLGVAIFFFLSGYGLMCSEIKSHLSPKVFFKRRFTKVYLPVLLATAFWLPIWHSITPPTLYDCHSICYSLFWGFNDGAMWFIRVLIPLYALFYICLIIGLKTNLQNTAKALLAICLIYTLWTMITSDSIRDHSIPFFALGAFAASKRDKHIAHTLCVILGIGLVSSSAAFATSHPASGFLHCLFDYFAVTALIAILSIKKIDIKAPAILGIISFDIYLTHFKVLEVTSLCLSLPAFIIMAFIVTAVVSLLFYKLRTFIIDTLPSKLAKSTI